MTLPDIPLDFVSPSLSLPTVSEEATAHLLQLYGYVDASHANDLCKHRSMTGYTFLLTGGVVAYHSCCISLKDPVYHHHQFDQSRIPGRCLLSGKVAKYDLCSILSQLSFPMNRPSIWSMWITPPNDHAMSTSNPLPFKIGRRQVVTCSYFTEDTWYHQSQGLPHQSCWLDFALSPCSKNYGPLRVLPISPMLGPSLNFISPFFSVLCSVHLPVQCTDQGGRGKRRKKVSGTVLVSRDNATISTIPQKELLIVLLSRLVYCAPT
jgi:hypothetical protein